MGKKTKSNSKKNAQTDRVRVNPRKRTSAQEKVVRRQALKKKAQRENKEKKKKDDMKRKVQRKIKESQYTNTQ